MSTEIRPNPDHCNTVRLLGHDSMVDVFAMTGRETVTWRTIPRADFIAAVETECDGIFIPRAELPAVDVGNGGWPLRAGEDSETLHYTWATATGSNCPNSRPDWHRARAMAHLAIAEYLDAHPADHPDQDDLAQMIADIVRPGAMVGSGERKEVNAGDLARHLLATGRVQVTL